MSISPNTERISDFEIHTNNLITDNIPFMAKFAQYYLKYNLGDLFSHEYKDRRQELFGKFFEKNESMEFVIGEGDERKVYKHQVYHLSQNRNIIIMRIANAKQKTVEQDFKNVDVRHEPSCYVIIDNRENCRRIAIQKNKNAFGSTKHVGDIIMQCINKAMIARYNIGIELYPQFYPKDFYRAWRMHQHHTARLRFSLNPSVLPDELEKNIMDDDSIMGFAIRVNEEATLKKYRTVLELNPPEDIAFLQVDEESTYIRNLVNFSAKTGNRIEIITSDGAKFTCYIDDDEESDTIVCNELESEYLDSLFVLDSEERDKAELKVLEFVNAMKYTVDEKQEDVA